MTDGTPIKDSAPIPEPPKPAPTPEATTPVKPEVLSTKQEINTALENAGKHLLESKDSRIGLVALARLAGDAETVTPMGEELRHELIRALQADESAPESIKNVHVPDKLEKNAFEAFMLARTDKLPPDVVTHLVLEMNAGTRTIGSLTEQLQHIQGLREPLLTGILGENHAPFNTREDILKAAHLETTPAHIQLLKDTYAPEKKVKFDKHLILGKGLTIGFWAMMLLQLGMSLANDGSSGHH